jgi:hypothetical protein
MLFQFFRSHFSVLASITAFIAISSLLIPTLSAQPRSDSTPTFQTDYFTGGLSYALSAGRGRDRVAALFSGSYTRRFSPALSAELMVSQTDGYQNGSSFDTHAIKSLTVSDLTVYVFPLEHLAPTFSVGAGASMFWSFDVFSNNFANAPSYIRYFQTFSFGMNLKAQYLFPISQRIGLGFRGSAHFAYPAFQAEILNPPNPFLGSVPLPQIEPSAPTILPRFYMASLGVVVSVGF